MYKCIMEQILLQATTDKGYVFYMDKRAGKPVFTLSAHDEAVTGTHLHRKYKVNMLGGTLR